MGETQEKIKLPKAANTTSSPGYGGAWTPNIPSWMSGYSPKTVSNAPGYNSWNTYNQPVTNQLPSYWYSPMTQANAMPVPWMPQAPLSTPTVYPEMPDSPQPVASATTGELLAGEPGGQPLENVASPAAGQPAYDPAYFDIDNNPIDQYWYQNNNYGQSVLEWRTDENGVKYLTGRPGVPVSVAAEAAKSIQGWKAANPGKEWTSTYSPEFYKTQRPDDYNQWGLAGGMGKRNGTTQLRWNTPTPDWVRKVLDKNKNTNKSYDQSQLDQNQPVNIPGWAGNLVSWRT